MTRLCALLRFTWYKASFGPLSIFSFYLFLFVFGGLSLCARSCLFLLGFVYISLSEVKGLKD